MSDLVERKLRADLDEATKQHMPAMVVTTDYLRATLDRIQALETSLAEAGEQLRANAETLAQVPTAIAEARRQALEEAAKVAEELEVGGKTSTMEWANCMAHSRDIAQAIRVLASDEVTK